MSPYRDICINNLSVLFKHNRRSVHFDPPLNSDFTLSDFPYAALFNYSIKKSAAYSFSVLIIKCLGNLKISSFKNKG